MNRLQSVFRDLHAVGRRTLLPYITGGYPDNEATVEILRGIDPDRCAAVEIGIPYSDPIADGPVIQTSFSRALERGFRVGGLLRAIEEARARIPVALLAMVSYSIVFRRDPRSFVQEARAAGFDGLIVPDLTLEEGDELRALGRACDCPLVMIVAPNSPPERRRQIAARSDPFIYYQALAGVTGERRALPSDLAGHIRELRAVTGRPICVGFGISTAEHVRAVCEVADGAIVGSAIVRRMNEAVEHGMSRAELVSGVTRFVQELSTGLDNRP
jgi:tryptophan synthase alpha chain